MKELLVIMASVMPIEDLLDKLDESIQKYKSDKTEENLQILDFNALLFSAKRALVGTTPADFIDKLDRTKKAHDLLNPKQN